MERRKSFPVATLQSLNAWELDKVNYWRKISSPAKLGLKVSDPEDVVCPSDLYADNLGLHSDEQFLHYDETVVSSVNPVLEEVKIRSNSALDRDSGVHSDSVDCESKVDDSDKYSTVTSDPGLDNCCSLDVVTIRNESVLANTNRLESKRRLGSDGYETASSSGSSMEERPLFQNVNHHLMDSGQAFLPGEFYIERPSLIPERKHRIDGRSSNTCPNCGEVIRLTDFNNSSKLFEDIWEGQMVRNDKENSPSLVSTFEDEDDTKDIGLTDPYYIRLRRSLHAPASKGQPEPPKNKNFSVGPQGQLHIDYTANWEGLEQYIENLKR